MEPLRLRHGIAGAALALALGGCTDNWSHEVQQAAVEPVEMPSMRDVSYQEIIKEHGVVVGEDVSHTDAESLFTFARHPSGLSSLAWALRVLSIRRVADGHFSLDTTRKLKGQVFSGTEYELERQGTTWSVVRTMPWALHAPEGTIETLQREKRTWEAHK